MEKQRQKLTSKKWWLAIPNLISAISKINSSEPVSPRTKWLTDVRVKLCSHLYANNYEGSNSSDIIFSLMWFFAGLNKWIKSYPIVPGRCYCMFFVVVVAICICLSCTCMYKTKQTGIYSSCLSCIDSGRVWS